MSDIRLAVLLEPSKKFKRFAMVEIDSKFNVKVGSEVVQYYGIRDRDNWDLDDSVPAYQLVEIPPLSEFHTALAKLAGPYGIIWNTGDQKFMVCSFRFGLPYECKCDDFRSGKVVGKKLITTTRHVRIKADSWREVSRKLFRICVSGKLHGWYSKGRLERLYWDTEFNKLETEIVSLDSLQVK
jgi:hypothetical protein